MSLKGWIGIDLDGTLAKTMKWVEFTDIGPPIPDMVERVKQWLQEGIDVRIMTARAALKDPAVIKAVEDWCERHVGQRLPVTNEKDFTMVALYDDRAVQVERDTGRLRCEPQDDFDSLRNGRAPAAQVP